MRTFRVMNKLGCLNNEYIRDGNEYFLVTLNDTVVYRNVIPLESGFHPQSFMTVGKFKQALRDGDIIFTD